jgi:hypothetical protein
VASPPEQQGFANFADLEDITPKLGSTSLEDVGVRQTSSPPRSQRRIQPRQSSVSLASETQPPGGELAAARKLLAEAHAQIQQLQATVRSQHASIMQLQVKPVPPDVCLSVNFGVGCLR